MMMGHHSTTEVDSPLAATASESSMGTLPGAFLSPSAQPQQWGTVSRLQCVTPPEHRGHRSHTTAKSIPSSCVLGRWAEETYWDPNNKGGTVHQLPHHHPSVPTIPSHSVAAPAVTDFSSAIHQVLAMMQSSHTTMCDLSQKLDATTSAFESTLNAKFRDFESKLDTKLSEMSSSFDLKINNLSDQLIQTIDDKLVTQSNHFQVLDSRLAASKQWTETRLTEDFQKIYAYVSTVHADVNKTKGELKLQLEKVL